MSYFFQVVSKNHQGIIFSNTEYLCEETTKGNLLCYRFHHSIKSNTFTENGIVNLVYIFRITNFFTK